ncbi:response regulator transcription factor [Paenibacillus aquistagni]|uniref:DNA-binding response regulator, OmpR family, contains REC and winged-helix (WHTH) domain n=1 Tax=Paenibacillus aquistagni TaxID=1852522 RepID=A0A1X7JDM3_9BACL|nr:response regulator transcription factor [Paenibacillus aquistagni]NMM54216.1 response regulator transcription factor [Paenibacillus aquistagni]SMG25809.1 DNA-binding response regulator, OmpR family, contains REC and winged-helix (wHTH) domain [Paenibacillus aquistagni]
MHDQNIVVADHDKETISILSLFLTREGYQVAAADNGITALQLIHDIKPDLIILDTQLHGLDGMAVCKEVRKTSNVPIMFLSSDSKDEAIIHGLSIGADDYMTKPFSPSQLVARVKAHLRRQQHPHLNHQLLSFPGLEIDRSSYTVKVDGTLISLSCKEFDLLCHLAESPNKVFKLEHLYQLIWNSESFGDTRTLMVHISNLRKKIEKDPTNPRYILTVRGVGYKFSY